MKKIEVYMSTTGTTQTISPTSWFIIVYVHSQSETDSHLPSRLETAFLLDSGSFNFLLDTPT